jgi:type I restriction enzyme R subunit
MTPEAKARVKIDELLIQAGWLIFNHKQANIHACCGVAIREFPLARGHGTADYLLYVNGKAVGIIEAKKEGSTLRGVEVQSKKYSVGLPDNLPAWKRPLPFLYESTGIETHFSNGLDPIPCARSVFAFHRPETLANWLNQPALGVAESHPDYLAKNQTFLANMQNLPPLNQDSLWAAQIKAIQGLENSLKTNQPRALVQMATGSGKTFTAINLAYRLVKFAKAKRILFLVDRGNLGSQTLKEFQQFQSPYNNFKFTEEYIVQQLSSNSIDESARVCICTIQRMFSMLKGVELTEQEEQATSEELADLFKKPPPVEYNPNIPIETFDIIIIDECHRSIYKLWAQVLEYFDAYLIGLTATPNKQTFGFFNQNLVMEYSHQQAVTDGVNVPFDVYTIETKITQQGETIEAGYSVQIQDPQTRAKRWETMDEDFTYEGKQLDRDVVTPHQIRTVLETFRDKALPEIFPDRTWLPKTLIFAKDDNHAENIVQIAREVFKEGNEAVQKITYKTTGKKPEDLIKAFRTSPMPRIAVTVDMIATGTDIKAVEIVFFMRAVQSRAFFEQMKGRGVRVIKTEDLQAVTPDAPCKDHFVIIDAVGVCAATKTDSTAFEQQRNVSIEKLLQQIGLGSTETKALTTLAGRLARLEHRITGKEDKQLKQITDGLDLKALSRNLIDAVNPDIHMEHAKQQTGSENPDNQTIERIAEQLKHQAGKPFSNPQLREFIAELSNRTKPIIIDIISVDEVIHAGVSQTATEKAQLTINTFEEYINTHKDEITALQILFNRPYSQRLDLKAIKELAEQIEKPPYHLTKDNVWKAYAILGKSKDTATNKRLLTDLISLCRFAAHQDNELIPFAEKVQINFNSWLAGQHNQGIEFTEKQLFWLEKIREHITGSLSIDTHAFDYGVFAQAGGLGAFYDSFGDDYEHIIEQLNTALVA